MYVIFFENQQGNFFDKLVRWYTSSFKEKLNGDWKWLPSHCEILFNNKISFSADSDEDLVRFKYRNYISEDTSWSIVHVNLSHGADEDTVYKYCETKEGLKYDYAGIFAFFTPFVRQNKNKYFCSEICAEVIDLYTDIKIYKPYSSITPVELKKILLKHNKKIINFYT